MSEKPIFVTRPNLPPLDEFIAQLEKIWDSRILTNGGPFHQELEHKLCEFMGLEHIALFNNGTSALMIALKALGLEGEVITTPYTFVATPHALTWNSLKPIFVDVDPLTLNIDPGRIEEAITPATTAILGVHCYGRPCDTRAIKDIAERHNLRVIYDAAHAFRVNDVEGSILRHGDLSILSFHATKVFNTFEGGAIICHDAKTKRQLDSLKNFGIVDEETVGDVGLNGKMNELSAACGLLQLERLDEQIYERKRVDSQYRTLLKEVAGISCLSETNEVTGNYSYFPIIVGDEYGSDRDTLYQELKDNGIHARRYFYPLVSEFEMYRLFPSSNSENLPIATEAARRVICLPIYPELLEEDISRIARIVAG